ncbi:MAG: hypothetical protein KDA24_16310 [Deltaproteobacteria bacterium]|nr:hypothetical protein [Deltaproteobacteria bacterium]
MRGVGSAVLLAGLMVPLAAAADAESHRARMDWELAVHTTLLEAMDPILACGRPTLTRTPPPWLHVTLDIAPDGTRRSMSLSGPRSPRWLKRCLEETVPGSMPPHQDATARRVVRTLFYDDGLAEDGFPGPQRLRVPFLLGGVPEQGVAGVSRADLEELEVLEEGEEEEDNDHLRLEATSFVLTANAAVRDLQRRFWLQGLRDAIEARRESLGACGVVGRMTLGVDGEGVVVLMSPENPCAAEVVASVSLTASPDGTPGRLALHLEEGALTRAEWPGDEDVLLSKADEEMVLLARDRAGPATSDCYATGINQPFKAAWAGDMVVGVVVGSAGEVSMVLTAGELAGGSFARCVERAHQRLGFPAPKDGIPVLVLAAYTFSTEEDIALSAPEPDLPEQTPEAE